MKLLPKKFYQQPTIKIARNLLGTLLVHDLAEGRTVGRIVETEAYLANDPACHASRGETKRNQPMFGPPGHAYIYFIYGMYHCFNVVTGPRGTGEAVLIRALEPIEGLEIMEKRRKRQKNRTHLSPHQLCNGPAKLVIAMGITSAMNRLSLLKGPLALFSQDSFNQETGIQGAFSIVTTTRIGIQEGAPLPLRFYLKGNPCVSRK